MVAFSARYALDPLTYVVERLKVYLYSIFSMVVPPIRHFLHFFRRRLTPVPVKAQDEAFGIKRRTAALS